MRTVGKRPRRPRGSGSVQCKNGRPYAAFRDLITGKPIRCLRNLPERGRHPSRIFVDGGLERPAERVRDLSLITPSCVGVARVGVPSAGLRVGRVGILSGGYREAPVVQESFIGRTGALEPAVPPLEPRSKVAARQQHL
jgi:hypothetical protein